MTENTHTPVPWQVEIDKDQVHLITDEAGGHIAVAFWWDQGNQHIPTAANASFIVRACNSHDKLLKACEFNIAILSLLIGNKVGCGGINIQAALRKARAARDAAKGEA